MTRSDVKMMLLIALLQVITAHPQHYRFDWNRFGSMTAGMEEYCREPLKNIEECCELPELLPSASVSKCITFAEDQPDESAVWGNVGKGRAPDEWDWDEWVHSCSSALSGFARSRWNSDDDDSYQEDLDESYEDYQTNTEFKGQKIKKVRKTGHKGAKHGKSFARGKSGNQKTRGPWSFGRELLPDRSLDNTKVEKIISNSITNSTWIPLVETSLKTCSMGTSEVDITAFDPPRYAGQTCSIAADIYHNCVRRHLVINCPIEFKSKAGSTCAKRVDRIQKCNPFRLPEKQTSKIPWSEEHIESWISQPGYASFEEENWKKRQRYHSSEDYNTGIILGEEIAEGYKGKSNKNSKNINETKTKNKPQINPTQKGGARNGKSNIKSGNQGTKSRLNGGQKTGTIKKGNGVQGAKSQPGSKSRTAGSPLTKTGMKVKQNERNEKKAIG